VEHTESRLERWGRWLKKRRPRVLIEQIGVDLIVVFGIIWRIISELFGVVSARRCNTSQTGHPTKMTAKSDTYPVG
jgi:hypothetical protein